MPHSSHNSETSLFSWSTALVLTTTATCCRHGHYHHNHRLMDWAVRTTNLIDDVLTCGRYWNGSCIHSRHRDPPVNYYRPTLSAGGKDQLPIQGFQYRCTNCLELSVFIYYKFHYHHHLQGTSENRTVRCCIRLSLTFLLTPAPPIRTLDITAPPINVFDIDVDIDVAGNCPILKYWSHCLSVAADNAWAHPGDCRGKVQSAGGKVAATCICSQPRTPNRFPLSPRCPS